MNWREIVLVWKKETLDTLRDRRTILAMIVLPLLIYPIMIIGISQLGIHQVEKLRSSVARVAVVPPGSGSDLVRGFQADSSFVVIVPDDPEGARTPASLVIVTGWTQDVARKLAAGR